MARIEGTGIKAPSKSAEVANLNFLRNPKKFLQDKIDKKLDSYTKEGKTPFGTSIGGSAVGEDGLGRFDNPNELSDARPNFFSPDGGAFDERNNVQLAAIRGSDATAISSDVSGDIEGFNNYLRNNYATDMDDRRYKEMPATLQRIIRESYNQDKKDGRIQTGEGTLLNQKPSFVEQTKNLAGNIFNAITGTQPAAASQIPGGMPSETQFTSSNLQAASAPGVDTSFASYRMAGQPLGGEQPQEQQQKQESGIVTPFSQTSMGKGEPTKITPFSETSMGRDEPVKVTPFRETSMGNKTVTVDGQNVAPRQTVASLPSDYKQTEAREFKKAETFQRAKKNPNVKVGVDSKGQPRVTAVQKTRDEAGPSARTAQGNQARVQQNAKARAQAAAFNRQLSGTKPKTAKERAQDAAKARKKAGPNRTMSAGQQTRAQAGVSARTAQGNRARVKANARKRAQAAARKRRARKKSKKK